jgi:hypothetical protein
LTYRFLLCALEGGCPGPTLVFPACRKLLQLLGTNIAALPMGVLYENLQMALGGIVPIHRGCESEFLVPHLLPGKGVNVAIADVQQTPVGGAARHFPKEGCNKITS